MNTDLILMFLTTFPHLTGADRNDFLDFIDGLDEEGCAMLALVLALEQRPIARALDQLVDLLEHDPQLGQRALDIMQRVQLLREAEFHARLDRLERRGRGEAGA